jgi:hypothetical protein
MRVERLADYAANAQTRIEAGVRVLKHHLHARAQRPHLALGQARDVAPLEQNLALGRVDRAQDRAADRALARARLADEAERFAARDVETDVLHGVDDAGACVEALDETADAEKRLRHSALHRRQRLAWSGSTCRSGGRSTSHAPSRSAQRGAKRHPGALAALATAPGMDTTSRRPFGLARGAGQAIEQGARIRMARTPEHFAHAAAFHHLAGAHHGD